MRFKSTFWLLLLLMVGANRTFAQCPTNIGFEAGNFDGWECFAGGISSTGLITVSPTTPLAGRHTILANTVPQQKDYYGDFPVNCPNGSKYSVKLGSEGTGAQAERISYTFTIPSWQNDFSIIYNYAVVFENPNHVSYQQPKFTAKVFDVSANDYVGCGSFEFVASGGLPGFQASTKKASVFYKPWSPITIKLLGYAGKTIRLEFTNNDCSPGGHFGYAYVDVNENCASPISGNTYCAGTVDSMTLVAPFGFQGYNWYTSDFSTLLGTSNTLTLSPPPPPGTTYALEVTPYPGLGCLDTLRSTIQYSGTPFNLQVKNSVNACTSSGVDLTTPSVTAGSTPGMTFAYYTDLSQLNYIPTPSYVTTPGTYYIKGTNADGCNAIKPVTVAFLNEPTLLVQGTAKACSPLKADITHASFTAGSDPGLTISYWLDEFATMPMPSPSAIEFSGSYYIKGTDAVGCSVTKPIVANISITPDLNTVNQINCGKIDLTQPGTISVTANGTLSFWADAATTIPLQSPLEVAASGTYFVKATNADGCEIVKPISLTIKPEPLFSVSNPLPVKFPFTVDITAQLLPIPNATYSYWLDSNTTKPLLNFKTIDTTSIYYIKATHTNGCSITHSVKVVVDEPDIIPPNAISPNGDGINDVWEIPLLRRYPYCNVEVFNRYGQSLFSTIGYGKPWDGKVNSKVLPNGTYYYVISRGPGFPPISGYISIVK